ncbi:hypothetical protein BpHYR1_050551, partial [Brachionus plicatilis]
VASHAPNAVVRTECFIGSDITRAVVDDFKIFNRALTDTEIMNHYQISSLNIRKKKLSQEIIKLNQEIISTSYIHHNHTHLHDRLSNIFIFLSKIKKIYRIPLFSDACFNTMNRIFGAWSNIDLTILMGHIVYVRPCTKYPIHGIKACVAKQGDTTQKYFLNHPKKSLIPDFFFDTNRERICEKLNEFFHSVFENTSSKEQIIHANNVFHIRAQPDPAFSVEDIIF